MPVIVDTDVLIWYLKGNRNAYEAIEALQRFSISVVTYMELVQGMRNKVELLTLRRALREWGCELLYLTEEISMKAMFYVEQHYLAHSVQLADALIAATSVTSGLPILTGNSKHYRPMKEVQTRRFRP